MAEKLVIALEGGGTRSQAALLDGSGTVLHMRESTAVNTNFVALEQARQAVLGVVNEVLAAAGVGGQDITHFATSLVGARFGEETFGDLCPGAKFDHYSEMQVVFARAGIYRPHGVGLVAATGATVWGVRGDDRRELILGGWGSLLGDEGSAYAMGLMGLRGAVRAFEERSPAPTGLFEAVCSYFNLTRENFHAELVRLAYHKPLSRTEIAGIAPLVTRLAQQGDPLAQIITDKVADDLAALVLSAARRLFDPQETFDVVMAGGLVAAGDLILMPLHQKLTETYPHIMFKTGSEAPAAALGRLMLHNLEESTC